MSTDRDTILKRAEKLLRQGKLDGAIEQYVQLIDQQPEDWNSVNALGDLYLRAGRNDEGADQFMRVADHQFAEGFFPKAAALYKKALRVRPDDEHMLMQLAEIGERQGKFADAKLYLQKVAGLRRNRGEDLAAAECILRLGSLDGSDAESKVAAARAAQQIGDAFRAVELLKEAAQALDKADRRHDAFQLLAEAAEIDPFDAELRNRLASEFVAAGQPQRARAYLNAETAGDDPTLLLALATLEFADGKEDDARNAMGRLLALAPEREADVTGLAEQLLARGQVDSAFACVDALTDAALLTGDGPRAMEVLRTFVGRTPHLPGFMKLVEVAVDSGSSAALTEAQAMLADAYLAASRCDEARFIAEDLVRADPDNPLHADRLRRALVMAGEDDPEGLIAVVREGFGAAAEEEATEEAIEVRPTPVVEPSVQARDEPPPPPVLAPVVVAPPPEEAAQPSQALAPAPATSAVPDMPEVDLSQALAELVASVPRETPFAAAPPDPPSDIEDVFAQMRAKTARDQKASAALGRYEEALHHIERGQLAEAILALQSAVRVPLMRFRAAALLGRLHIRRGDVGDGVEWLERAAEAPAPTPGEASAVLYELAVGLEALDESARALAVFLELNADAPGDRDVRDRITRLTQAQPRSGQG